MDEAKKNRKRELKPARYVNLEKESHGEDGKKRKNHKVQGFMETQIMNFFLHFELQPLETRMLVVLLSFSRERNSFPPQLEMQKWKWWKRVLYWS